MRIDHLAEVRQPAGVGALVIAAARRAELGYLSAHARTRVNRQASRDASARSSEREETHLALLGHGTRGFTHGTMPSRPIPIEEL